MFKEIALGVAGLGTAGGVGTLSVCFGRPILESAGLIAPLDLKGWDITYKISGGNDESSQEITCKGQPNKYSSLKLEVVSGLELKTKITCENKEQSQDLKAQPLITSEISCKQESETRNLVKCSLSESFSSQGKQLKISKDSGNPESIILSL
ncbi:hypothetical protein MHLP_01330 [Candidatus Mycoplasma haematolamae str. Purdue]|uniref:Uncharacterized protein n=1 Tax=Mycoplasma haematolamae (strain Purdue) TaxID=1212765 RepID=I7CF04_MYCHA|nr:hypothetical protein [Candidatus Mycoplasma haematolamae]AFO51846.1 hypothetical protein MHLP_01330 [Candidatus Mycoplasma haematolamae str. Purdue]